MGRNTLTLRYLFLVLEEHPYGREMLRILLERGLSPAAVIEESSPVADEERAKFLTRIAGEPLPPLFDDLLAARPIPRHRVAHHNHGACLELLRSYRPDLLVLGGTRIVSPDLLAIPPRGTVNAHPGLLPWLRGSSSVGWALYKDLPLGASVHFVEPAIDTGPVILKRRLAVHRGQRYEAVERAMLTLAGALMAEALALLAEGPVRAVTQDPSEGETLRVIPSELLAEAKARLALGHYSHLID